MGIFALSSSSPRAEKQGRGRRIAGGARAADLGLGGGHGEGGKREGGGRVRFPAAARPEAARGGLATTAGGSRRRVALGRRPGLDGASGGGEKREEEVSLLVVPHVRMKNVDERLTACSHMS